MSDGLVQVYIFRKKTLPGILAIRVSTIGAADEKAWATVEKHLNGCSKLHLQANFGPGSAGVIIPWATAINTQDADSEKLQRDAKLHLPYFNLADGVKSTDASLVLEVIIQNHSSDQGHASKCPEDDELSLSSSSSATDNCEQQNRYNTAQPKARSLTTLATGTLDVQMGLTTTFSRTAATSKEKCVVPFTIMPKERPAALLCPELPDSIPVAVELTFSKTGLDAADAGEQQPVERVLPRTGNGAAVPAVFVVATTLFDCSTAMKDAELRLYVRRGDARTASKISCRRTGAIGRWYPLRAGFSSADRNAHGAGTGAVGEALVAFAWMQQGPATAALSRDPIHHNRDIMSRKRPRRKRKEGAQDRDSAKKAPQSKRAEASSGGNSDAINITRPITGHGCGDINGALQQETQIHIHVWDALLPLAWSGSAVYLTVRLCCPGSRIQRVSTKPARCRGGPSTSPTASGSSSNSSRRWTNRSSRAGSVHVVWDEHLTLSVADLLDEGAVVELLVRDASVDKEVPLATREGEPVRIFAERNKPVRVGETASLSQGDMASPFRLPGPVIYRLRLQYPPGDMNDNSDPALNGDRVEENHVGFGGVEVRMAGLVLERNCIDYDDDGVKAFLQRKADVARVPRRLTTVGGGGGASFSNRTVVPTREMRRPGRRSRLLDLSAANGLFHKFAEDQAGGRTSAEGAVNMSSWSPRTATGGDEPKTSRQSEPGDLEDFGERFRSSSEPVLTKEGLSLVAQQYFPGLAEQPDCGAAGADATATSRHLCGDHSAPKVSNENSHGIGFTEFVSWLRSLPEADLVTAGLLVSPRTALHTTGVVMDGDVQYARELAAALELAREPTAMLIGGWCSVPLRSTVDATALERVRLGWGPGGSEDRDGGGPAEMAWRRHTEMLRRDVGVLSKALVELEHRCGDRTVSKEAESIGISDLDHGVGDDPAGRTEEEPANAFPEEECSPKLEVDGMPPTVGEVAVATHGRPNKVEAGVAQNEPDSSSIAAVYIGQQATRLGAAAEHLKEALRCAGDALSCDATRIKAHPSSGGRYCGARRDAETKRSRGNGRSNRVDLSSGSFSYATDEVQAHRHHQQHGLLLRHIKQVTSFQAEIASFQRRAAALAPRKTEEPVPLVRWQGDDFGYGGNGASCGAAETPRSGLALVKRIRRAQSAARRQTTVESTPGAIVTGEEIFPALCNQSHGDDSATSSDANDDRDSSGGDGAAVMKDQQQQERGLSAGVPDPEEDGSMALSSSHAETLFSPRTPFSMFRNPSSPENLRERLDSIRTAFLDSATDLPASYPRIAERILDTASENATCTTKLVTSAAVCCPIDRFALHVFRTAGAAGETGSTVYTDVQELAGIGGLDTQTSENSLWSAAARAGIVDVERWVVAAVLWQVADAVASTDKSFVPSVRSPGSMEGASEIMAGDDTSDAAAVSTKAMSLWEELRDEAFRSVLSRSIKNENHGRVPNAEPSSSSPVKAGTLSTPRKHDHQREGALVLVGEDVVSHRVDRRALQRYKALRSGPSSFDRALMRTLVLASGAGAAAAAAAASPTAGGRASWDSGVGGSLDCVEDILLHNFVVAGFVDGSCLSVSDIVDAVSARRQRVALTATAGGLISGGAKEGMDNGVASDENGHRPAKPQALTELPEDHRHRLSRGEPVPQGETRAASVVKGEEDPMSDDNAVAVSVSMLETDVESRLLLGIPAELRELFRAASLAGVGHQGSLEKDELENAEWGVLQVLDSNRTLETAPFSGGRTALHHAAARGDEFLVRLLLERGCKPHLKHTRAEILNGARQGLPTSKPPPVKINLPSPLCRSHHQILSVQDFEGKRASDLTRDLKCLRLLGALKKGCKPSAVSLRGSRENEEAATASGRKEKRVGETPLSSARAMANVEFAVSFRLRGDEEIVRGTSRDRVRCDGSTETPRDWKQRERAEDEQIRIIHGRGAWVNGVARSYDLRNKVLLIDEIYPDTGPGGTTAAAHPTIDSSGPAENETGAAISTQGQLPDEEQLRHWRSTGGERRSYRCSRHVLDVRLLSSLSPHGEELFDQLQEFSSAFKTNLARALLDVAVDAAAALGASCRMILDGLVGEIVEDEVVREACRNERLAVATKNTAAVVVAGVFRAAQRAVVRAGRLSSQAVLTNGGEIDGTAGGSAETGPKELVASISVASLANAVHGGNTQRANPVVVDKSVAARMRFSCTTIVSERRHTAATVVAAAARSGAREESAADSSPDVIRRNRKRRNLQYMARWTVENGVSTVVVRGRSYLDAIAAKKRGGSGSKPINLEGRDAGIRCVLDHHGVTLSACLQTFDVMQDMEDPNIVLEMLATGICQWLISFNPAILCFFRQLSARNLEEGVEFASLRQSEQDILKAEVLSQLYQATDHSALTVPEWDELKITLQAFGGVTSVSLSRSGESSKAPGSDGEQDLVVFAPTTAGWFSPDEVAAALTSPPTLQDSLPSTTAASSSFAEPLPPSAVDLVVTLMRCNPCEVLGSLCRGIDTDGRIALIGRVENGGASQASAVDTAGGRAGGKGGGVNDGCTFRCSLEVAWNKDEGGVFVRRFSMDRDEKRPRFTLRAVGIRRFSIAQLPVTLEDIDEVEDQGGVDDTSGSDTSTSHGCSRGSTNSSVTTLRSSQGGKGQPSPPASIVASSAKSEESSERGQHSAILAQSAASAERGSLIHSGAAAATTTSRTARTAASIPVEAPYAKFSSAQDDSEEDSRKPETTAAAATATAAVAAAGIAPRGTGEDDDLSSTSDQSRRSDGKETSDTSGCSTSKDRGRSMREDRIVESVVKENLDQPSEIATNYATKGVVSKQERRHGAVGASSPATQVDTKGADGSRQAGSEVVTTNKKPASGGGLNEMAEANIDEGSRGQGETEEVNEGGREDEKHGDDDGKEESTKGGAGNQEDEEEALEQQKKAAEDKDGSESRRERNHLTTGGNTDAGEVTRPADMGPPLRGSDGILLRRGSTEDVVKANTITSMDVGAVANRVPKDMITPLVKQGFEELHSARSIRVEDEHGGSDAGCATTGQVQMQALPHANPEALAPDVVRADESISLQRDSGRAADPAAVLGEGASSVGMLNALGEDLGTTPPGDAKHDGTYLKATCNRDAADEVVVEGTINNEPLGVLTVPSSYPLSGSAPGTIEDIDEVNNGDKNGDVEELFRQQDKRSSSPLADGEGANDDGQTTSATTVETGECEQVPAEVLNVEDEGDTDDNEGVPPRLNEEVTLEEEEGQTRKQHELNRTASVVDAQRLQDQTLDDVNGKSEEDAVNSSQDKLAAEKADQGDLNGKDADRMASTSNSTDSGDVSPANVWTFPPSFEALMTLSTANNTVECEAEGEITLEVEADTRGEEQASTHGDEGQTKKRQEATPAGSPENNVEPFWRSRYCIYRIAAEEGSQTPPVADIDLEDDDAQARLEHLLGESYGITMEEVLDRFSPETDLSSGDAVVRSFTNSICELRPSLLRGQPKSISSDDGRPGGRDSHGRSDDGAVYKAVEAALRGRGGGSPWREVQVRVATSRVLDVRVVTTSSDDTTRGEDIVENGSNAGGPSATTLFEPPSKGAVCTSAVDCSGIDSPAALRPHLLAGGVPASAADALDRAGFFAPGPVVDLAGVLAALADEARTGGPSETHAATVFSQSSPGVKKKEGTGSWPGLDAARSRRKELHVPHGARRSGSFATIHKCTVAVTGTPEDIQLDILPAGTV
ncbi:unnamed protein product [Ectocarpus sp. CCAP 1310/34]|nr:unnamed protein product [Ectocarpus sp. CCAP 1310/34]